MIRKQNVIIEIEETPLSAEQLQALVTQGEALINGVAKTIPMPLQLHAHREILHTMNELGIAAHMVNSIDAHTASKGANPEVVAVMLNQLVQQLDKVTKRAMLLSYTINQVIQPNNTGDTTNETDSPA